MEIKIESRTLTSKERPKLRGWTLTESAPIVVINPSVLARWARMHEPVVLLSITHESKEEK